MKHNPVNELTPPKDAVDSAFYNVNPDNSENPDNSSDSPDDSDSIFNLLIFQYQQARRKDKNLSVELFAQANPQYAQRLREVLPLVGHMDKWAEESCGALPAVLGGYKIISKIGQGGMGDVYLAQQRALNRTVAIKVLRNRTENGGTVSLSESAQIRLETESQIIAKLRHTNIWAHPTSWYIDLCIASIFSLNISMFLYP